MKAQLVSKDEEHFLDNKEVLQRLIEYARYLYEEEVKRAERFHNATKTYLVFICATFAGTIGTLKWLDIQPSKLLPLKFTIRDWALGGIFIFALLIILLSFILTILVVKTWRTERLCDPHEFFAATVNSTNERHVLELILSNFLVAAQKNGKVNDKKGILLAAASQTYHIGLLLLIIGGIIYVVLW